MSQGSSDTDYHVFKLEMFLRDPARKKLRKKFDNAIRSANFESAFIEVTNYGFPENMALDAAYFLTEYPDYYFEKIREKISDIPPLKKVELDSSQASEKLKALAEVKECLKGASPKPSHSRGMPADRNKPTTGKRRTLQFNSWKKKS